VRGILKAAAYVPPRVVDGRRTAGPDEDGFTLAAAALERLFDESGRDLPVDRILLLGTYPPTAEGDLARFLGSKVPAVRCDDGESGLRAALAAALDPGLGSNSALIVLVDLPSQAESNGIADQPPPPDAGVALLVGENARLDPNLLWGDRSGKPVSATASLFRLAEKHRAGDSASWVGDWDPTPAAGRVLEPPRTTPRSVLPGGPVSQGAYVPRRTYLDNLPSRWWFAAEKCPSCGTVTFPARGRCKGCGRREGLETLRLPRDGGEVIASTVIGPGGQPTEFDDQVESTGPYGVVIVQLAPGVRVTLQATDFRPGVITIGTRVATRLRRLYPMEGEWRYGRKAVPLS
jgi:uncharacterized OB-fold protein